MKRLLIILFVLVTAGSYAQVTFGLKGGLNIANTKVSFGGLELDTDPKIGFHIGGFMNYALSDNLVLQPELIYNSVGGTSTYVEPPDYSEEYEWNPSYLSIPVMLKYNINEKFNLQGGLQLGLLVGGKLKYTENDFGFILTTETDVDTFVNGTDISLNLGAGFNINEMIDLTFRYCLGISDVAKSTLSGAEIKLNTIQFSFGYKITQ
ncbi:MAG: PorT family protein [Flammeovirgaceae bacterium]|nr:PorT family protein [Flammeovirgaceae bacterium]